jgi:putative metallohydrolase (TIGR04338 family)
MKDAQKSKVYAAEQVLRVIFDRAVESGNPMVEVEGVALTLPPEAKFASVESVQAYCDRVTEMVGATKVRVRSRQGDTHAHYEAPGVIAVPDGRNRWALREIVVLHELAHHLSRSRREAHGPEFVVAFIDLLSTVMGPEVGLAMRMIAGNTEVRQSVGSVGSMVLAFVWSAWILGWVFLAFLMGRGL